MSVSSSHTINSHVYLIFLFLFYFSHFLKLMMVTDEALFAETSWSGHDLADSLIVSIPELTYLLNTSLVSIFCASAFIAHNGNSF